MTKGTRRSSNAASPAAGTLVGRRRTLWGVAGLVHASILNLCLVSACKQPLAARHEHPERAESSFPAPARLHDVEPAQQHASLPQAYLAARQQEGATDATYHLHSKTRALRGRNPALASELRFEEGIELAHDGWRLRVQTRALYCGEHRTPLSANPLVAESSQPHQAVRAFRSARIALREWFINGPLGVEQGWTFDRNPCAPGESLAIEVRLDGLKARAGETGQVVLTHAGRDVLRYGEAYAQDATGREHPVSLRVSAGDQLLVSVATTGVSWPLTVDPLIATFETRLTQEVAHAGDKFGAGVAAGDDVAIVGAPGVDVDGKTNQGAVYVFTRVGTDGWSRPLRLTARDGQGADAFGAPLAFDGETLVVGAPQADGNRGGAYVFRRTRQNAWTKPQKLATQTANEAEGADGTFGTAVAVHGNTLVVGAPGHDKVGAAYVYVRSGETWSLLHKLKEPQPEPPLQLRPQPYFGRAVAVHGDTVVVGAPRGSDGIFGHVPGAAFVFRRTESGWNSNPDLRLDGSAPEDAFGLAVAVSVDTIAVGAPNEEIGKGAVAIYSRDGARWSTVAARRMDASQGNTSFGASVAIEGNGLLVGAPGHDSNAAINVGAMHLFTRASATDAFSPNPTHSLLGAVGAGFLGHHVSLGGTLALAGAPLRNTMNRNDLGGAVAVARTNWSALFEPTLDERPGKTNWGAAVALDGANLVIGVPRQDASAGISAGAAYVFERAGRRWLQLQRVAGEQNEPTTVFAEAVALNGNRMLVRSQVGIVASVAVYARGDVWTREGTLSAPPGVLDSYGFGQALAIVANLAAVGTPHGGGGKSMNQGAVYLFERGADRWGDPLVLTSGAADDEFDQFGAALALEGDTVVVGAPYADVDGKENQGAVYVFTRSGAVWSVPRRLVALEGAAEQFFGQAVALYGGYMAVGAPSSKAFDGISASSEPGSVYVFVRVGDMWIEQAHLWIADVDKVGQLGSSVALDGATLVAGAPGLNRVEVFARSQDTWRWQLNVTETVPPTAAFGSALALEGNTLIVSAPGDSVDGNPGQGAAYTYRLSGVAGSTCTNASQCVEGYFCDPTMGCQPRGELAGSCRDTSDCAAGLYCVDGVCCNRLCDNQCEACDVPGMIGTCSAVTGVPHNGRPACGGSDPSCVGACDGQARDGCIFPDLTKSCGTPFCIASVVTRKVCDGRGGCAAAAPESCVQRGCNREGTDCAAMCTTARDCAAGAACDLASSQCVFVDDICVDAFTAQSPDGSRLSCGAYRCQLGVCASSCEDEGDCSGDYTCNEDGRCERASTYKGSDGCGCNLARRSATGVGSLASFLALLSLLRLRRRPATRASARAPSTRPLT